MASEPKPPAITVPERFKYRLRFCKGGDLRLVSHHDLMHCCERLFRRADVPVAATQGFHPSPRIVFALSLSLGVLGSNEVMELELTRDVPEAELLELLRLHAPPGLTFHNVCRIPLKTTAQVRRSFYRIALSPAPVGGDGAPLSLPSDGTVTSGGSTLGDRCDRILARDQLWMARAKPYRRRVDIRPFIESFRVSASSESVAPGANAPGSPEFLDFTLWMTPFGTAKPDEVLRLLELDHLPAEGSILERFDLELIDEVGPDAPPLPIVDPKAIISTTLEDIAVPEKTEPPDEEVPRPTSLVEGPMSFDT